MMATQNLSHMFALFNLMAVEMAIIYIRVIHSRIDIRPGNFLLTKYDRMRAI